MFGKVKSSENWRLSPAEQIGKLWYQHQRPSPRHDHHRHHCHHHCQHFSSIYWTFILILEVRWSPLQNICNRASIVSLPSVILRKLSWQMSSKRLQRKLLLEMSSKNYEGDHFWCQGRVKCLFRCHSLIQTLHIQYVQFNMFDWIFWNKYVQSNAQCPIL